MPLTPDFTATQVLGSPENIVLTDVSTGSDVAITQRRVYIQLSDGSYLVEDGTTTDYEAWALATNPLTLDVLTQDQATAITVQWLDVSNTVLYTKTQKIGFTLYNETFDYQLTQQLSANPPLMNDNKFQQNKFQLRVDIDSGNQAISFAGDLFSAQLCYDAATDMYNNRQYLFNINS